MICLQTKQNNQQLFPSLKLLLFRNKKKSKKRFGNDSNLRILITFLFIYRRSGAGTYNWRSNKGRMSQWLWYRDLVKCPWKEYWPGLISWTGWLYWLIQSLCETRPHCYWVNYLKWACWSSLLAQSKLNGGILRS